MMEKTYLIVGDNNFWYATIGGTEKRAKFFLGTLKKDIKRGEYEDNKKPETLYLYEAKEIGQTSL